MFSDYSIKTKQLLISCLMLCLYYPNFSHAQNVPQGINYQAAARNSEGDILPNQNITAEVSLFSESENEPPVYREIHECQSNSYGIFNLTIGQGTPLNEGLTSNFSEINWFSGSYILKVRADFGSDEFLNGMKDLGSYTVLSVPYAFSADKALTADSITGDISLNLNELADVSADNPADRQILAWDAESAAWILSDPGGLPDVFLRRDGSTDLTADWTITDNSLILQNGNIDIQNGNLTAFIIKGQNGTGIRQFSNDPLLTDSSDTNVPTQSAVKAYIDNSSGSGPWMSSSTAVFMSEAKRLGIGTEAPLDKFHLELGSEEGFIVKGTQGGNIPNSEAGPQMTFYPARSAFRAGALENMPNYWNNENTGAYSVAFGLDNLGYGDYSFTLGRENIAYGLYSIASGRNNQSMGIYSFASGRENVASAPYSFTAGYGNSASGTASAAFGEDNTARGNYSLAVGLQTQAGKDDGSEGLGALAVGQSTRAEADGSLASGKNNTTLGNYSLISGENNYIAGSADHAAAFGKNNSLEGQFTMASGSYLNLKTRSETVLGQYNAFFAGSAVNWNTNDPLFILGNGTNEINRSNALIILKNAQTGIGIGNSLPMAMLQVGTEGDGSLALANAWNIHSDRRLKKNIQVIESASEKLMQMHGYYYNWKDSKDTTLQIGLIAQEAEKVFPEIVSTDKKGFKSVNYPVVTAILTQAFNEQQKEIAELKSETQVLKNRMKNLEEKQEEMLELIKAQANIKMTED